ncbi:MAG: phosphoenolpyruvate carboxykinase domain-containing protein, partial [Acidimicrobiia bacterium]
IGVVPTETDLNLDGLDASADAVRGSLGVDEGVWGSEVAYTRKHFDHFGDRLPGELREQLAALEQRLG